MKEALKINHNNDEFFTPTYAVKPLLKYIPRDVKTIWCPCDTEDSKIFQVLQGSGYKVYCSHIDYGHDFLKYDLLSEYDMIITNPPYLCCSHDSYDWDFVAPMIKQWAYVDKYFEKELNAGN